MSNRTTGKSKWAFSYKGLMMGIGLILGGAIGLSTGNIAMAGGGMVIGLAIGSAIDKDRQENRRQT